MMKELISRFNFDEDAYFELFKNNSGYCVRIWSDYDACQKHLSFLRTLGRLPDCRPALMRQSRKGGNCDKKF